MSEKCPELDEQRLVDLLSAATAPNRIDDREREAELGHKAAQALDVIRYLRRQLAQRDEQLAALKAVVERLPNLSLVADFLDDLGERLGNAGCNDLLLTNTAEHRAIWEAASDEGDRGDDWPPPETEAVFYAVDFVVVQHLAARLREAADLSAEALAKAEQARKAEKEKT